MTPALSIRTLTDRQLIRYVNDAFKQFHSALLLSRSPLADSSLVTPTLVRDDVSPTADERGNGLRLILRWAVERLAPGPIAHPLGTPRPYDDPTWMEPAWWRYNILRHRYLEPLHPDEFVEGGRYTETLMALTGIPSQDIFFDERNRAIRDLSQWLRSQAADGAASVTLQQQALDAVYQPLHAVPQSRDMLGIAAMFTDLFPRSLLAQIAKAEGIEEVNGPIERLISLRCLLSSDDGASLWLSPVLRSYVYRRQERDRRRIRHLSIGTFYLDAQEPLKAAHHLREAGESERAARLLLDTAQETIAEMESDALRDSLLQFEKEHVDPESWCEIQILLCDLHFAAGRHDDALDVARSALTVAHENLSRARIYRRMGKIYEQRNQLHALTYYEQAAAFFSSANSSGGKAHVAKLYAEQIKMFKDRAWVRIERSEWSEAEDDLQHALALVASHLHGQIETEAEIYDALASLHRHQKQDREALEHAQKALVLREQAGDLSGIGKSFNNLGILYSNMGETINAVAAHREAFAIFERMANGEHMANALLNIGASYHFGGEMDNAIEAYCQCLTLCEAGGWTLTQSRCHSNLAEALAERGDTAEAQRHWTLGYGLSLEAGLDDEIAYYQEILNQFPALEQGSDGPLDGQTVLQDLQPSSRRGSVSGSTVPLDRDQELAIDHVDLTGRITTSEFIDSTGVSKATATRKLAALVEGGYLQRHGKGRGTFYTLAGGAEQSTDG